MDNIIKEAVKELESKLSGSVCEIIKTKIDEADKLREEIQELKAEYEKNIKKHSNLYDRYEKLKKETKEVEESNIRLTENNNYWKSVEKDLERRETSLQEQILQSRVLDQEMRIQDMKYLIEVAFKAGKHNDQTTNQDTDLQ